MSRITNILGLPQPLVAAVANDPYDKGIADISVTSLIGPARIRQLRMRHADEITEDVSERLFALMGSVAHDILERADTEAWTEERLFITRHGWVISGKFDRCVLHAETLQDYKVTATYSINDGPKDEWVAQANIYRLMLHEHGHKVNRLQTVAILRDWQKSKAKKQDSYPQVPAVVLDMPVWSLEQTEAFITERLIAHGKAQTELPDCTPEERWESPPLYRLMKAGNVRPTSTHESEADASAALDAAIQKAKPGIEYYVETVPATPKRCADYCPVAPWCDQWKRLQPGGTLASSLGARRMIAR